MSILDAGLAAEPLLVYGFLGLLGLLVGSFLNVVIHRLPLMLQAQWRQECENFLQIKSEVAEKSVRFNLAWPASHCPQCAHPLKVLDNIPVVSYLLLRGRCRYCQGAIKASYPLVEISTCVLTLMLAWHFFGQPLPLLAAFLLWSWGLIALTWIDARHQLLPDHITLPLLWLGLMVNYFQGAPYFSQAFWGAIVGYMLLWSLYWVFKLLTGKEGMGYGDFKLLAMLGAWLGVTSLPPILLFASVTGALYGMIARLSGRLCAGQPMPFGPFLAVGGLIALFAEQAFWQWLSQ